MKIKTTPNSAAGSSESRRGPSVAEPASTRRNIMMGQPSIVDSWKRKNMARPMLSKEPKSGFFHSSPGPTHASLPSAAPLLSTASCPLAASSHWKKRPLKNCTPSTPKTKMTNYKNQSATQAPFESRADASKTRMRGHGREGEP